MTEGKISKERQAPFIVPMVRALLDGSKTQTRRIVKMKQSDWCKEIKGDCWHPNEIAEWRLQDGRWFGLMGWYTLAFADCPYGQIGDMLWVRESAKVIAVRGGIREIDIEYQADGVTSTVKYPSRLAPAPLGKLLANGTYREASRILLEITNIRVERLQDITPEDSIAEGVVRTKPNNLAIFSVPGTDIEKLGSVAAYAALWESINGPGSWDTNPWVWVVEFERIPTEARG